MSQPEKPEGSKSAKSPRRWTPAEKLQVVIAAVAVLQAAGAAAPAATPPTAIAPAAARDEAARLATLAARCGSEIDWCTTWDEAARRAREQQRPILALVRAYQGLQLTDLTMVVPFSEEPIVAIVRDRFVALRFKVGDAAPFTAPELYGVGPSAFGTTLLVLDADGRVHGDTFTVETSTLHDYLRERLPAASRPAALPRGEAGLAALEAEAAADGGARAEELTLPRVELLTRLGRRDEALALVTAIPEGDARRAAALYWRGTLEAGFDKKAARATWMQLLDEHESSRWAPIVAVLLQLGYLELLTGAPEPWPDEDVAALTRMRTRAPLPAGRAAEAERDALRYLLDAQRPDGSWLFAGEVVNPGAERRDLPLATAITALATRALLLCAAEAGADARVAPAIERGLAWLHETALRTPVVSPVLDHHVWARAALLRCVAAAVDAGFADPDEWHDALATTTAALLATQRKGGGFSYYQGPDPERPDPKLEVSFSFVTAWVVQALRDAKAVGVDVPDEALARAVDCLWRCRDMDQTWTYALAHANEGARDGKPSGAAGRGPLCAWTLAQAGRAEQGDVVKALDHFLACREAYAREQGKTLMHCGPEGEGSHYLLFDYAFAALAAASLPEAQRARYRGPLLDLVLAARGDDGGFVDNPAVGAHAGTALALEALRALRGPRTP